jgi:hypothetical protein
MHPPSPHTHTHTHTHSLSPPSLSQVAPKEYVAHDHAAQVLLEGTGRLPIPSLVTSLHLSPFCAWAFAAGHDDGTLTVHSTALATASVVGGLRGRAG